MAKTIPERFVAKSGGGNRVGKIFVDYLRNGQARRPPRRSRRARGPGMGVSMPVSWEQLMALKSGAQWTIADGARVPQLRSSDPWADYWRQAQTLAAAMKSWHAGVERRLQRNARVTMHRAARRLACFAAGAADAGRDAPRGDSRSLMAARSIASLSLSFGLVSIPVKLYSATESSAAVGFNMLTRKAAGQAAVRIREDGQSSRAPNGERLRIRKGSVCGLRPTN